MTSPMILVASWAGSGSPPSAAATSAAKSSTECTPPTKTWRKAVRAGNSAANSTRPVQLALMLVLAHQPASVWFWGGIRLRHLDRVARLGHPGADRATWPGPKVISRPTPWARMTTHDAGRTNRRLASDRRVDGRAWGSGAGRWIPTTNIRGWLP